MRYVALWLMLDVSVAHAQAEVKFDTPPRLISALCVDLVEAFDGCEMVSLIRSTSEPNAADLIITSAATSPSQLLIVARNLSFDNSQYDQPPQLDTSGPGTFTITEEQSAYGRTPWFQAITIAHAQSGFAIIQYSYSTYDRIAGGDFSCDIDHVTGRWTASGTRYAAGSDAPIYDIVQSGQIEARALHISEWSTANGQPPVCHTAFNDWFEALPE